ncbi:hypothetical protein ACHAXR_002894 [Thalassiosira sp. AJA248-18]
MRREHSTNSLLSAPSSPTSSSRRQLCDFKKLNLLAFAGTLVYIGYLFGCVDNGGSEIVNSALSINHGKQRQLRATSIDASASWDSISVMESQNKNADKTRAEGNDERQHASPNVKTEDSPNPTYAKGPVIDYNKGPITSINLIGERHSGTNWITAHLEECFGGQIPVETEFTRYKHWFQFDDATVRNESALVIALFRDPYDWVEAMREGPHHAHNHIEMEWFDFVTKPWVGPRGSADRVKMDKAKAEGFHIEKWDCLAGYKFDEVIPCSSEDSVEIDGYSNYMYELKNDASHRAYSSIIELRTAKILNFLQVPQSHGVKAFFPERYEALNLRGTAEFLKQLEEVTGLKAKCEPFAGTGVINHKDVDPEYTEWMNKYHDWNAEAMIGYVKRDPAPRKNIPPPQQQEKQIDLDPTQGQPARVD